VTEKGDSDYKWYYVGKVRIWREVTPCEGERVEKVLRDTELTW